MNEVTVDAWKANLVALVLAILILFIPVHFLVCHGLLVGVVGFFSVSVMIFIGSFVHELIHFSYYYRNHVAGVRLGFAWLCKVIPTPYTTFDGVVEARQYRTSLLLPTSILVPSAMLLGVVLHSYPLFVFASSMLIGGVGDMLVWRAMRDVPPDSKVHDHPTKIGALVVG